MKAWDTNLLVRHLTEDNLSQLKIVWGHLLRAEQAGEPVWIADMILVETFWVLQHGYGVEPKQVVEILLKLTDDARFLFQSGSDVHLVLERVRIREDLPGHLIALAARRAGAEKTQTFDRAVKRFTEFEVL